MARYLRMTLQIDRLASILDPSGDISAEELEEELKSVGKKETKSSELCNMKKAKQLYQKLVLGVDVSDDDDLSESDDDIFVPTVTMRTQNESVSQESPEAEDDEVSIAIRGLLQSEQTNTSRVARGSRNPEQRHGQVELQVLCDECGLTFPSIQDAVTHKNKSHPGSNIRHYCPHCGQHFSLKAARDEHISKEHPNQKRIPLEICEQCGGQFYTKGALGFHMKTLHLNQGGGSLGAGYMNLAISSGTVLSTEPVITTGNIITSDISTVMSSDQPVITTDIVMGTEAGNYDGHDIITPGTLLPSKKILMTNKSVHVQFAYYCHLCGAEHCSKESLQTHLEVNHVAKERLEIPQNVIRCTTCSAMFYNQSAFDGHVAFHGPTDLYAISEEPTKILTDDSKGLEAVQIPDPCTVAPLPGVSMPTAVSLGKRKRETKDKKILEILAKHSKGIELSESSSESD